MGPTVCVLHLFCIRSCRHIFLSFGVMYDVGRNRIKGLRVHQWDAAENAHVRVDSYHLQLVPFVLSNDPPILDIITVGFDWHQLRGPFLLLLPPVGVARTAPSWGTVSYRCLRVSVFPSTSDQQRAR